MAAPYGYVLSSEPVPFTIDGSEAVVTVTQYNMPQKGQLTITKTGEVFASVQENDGLYQPVYEVAGLPGAVYDVIADEDIYTGDGTLRVAKDTVVETLTTGEDGTATSVLLYLGRYRLEERQAPAGMVVNAVPEYAELTYAGETVEVTQTAVGLYDERQKVDVALFKALETDELFGLGMNEEYKDISFGLYASADLTAADGSVIPAGGLLEVVSVSANEAGGYDACFDSDLPFGSYYVQERTTNSAWAIRRMNDKLCLEHGLSIVENPKPSRDHYGTWLGNTKQPSFQEQLRRAIDAALEERPKDFEDFLKKLEAAGIEVNRERKNLRLRGPGQKNYTRCNTLKGDYTEQAIQERIEGTRTAKPRRTFSQKPVPKAGLLVDIEAAVRAGKGPGYERWAKVFNLKQLSQAVIYLKEHGDMSYEDLLEKAAAATISFNALSAKIKELESQMTANGELQKQIVNYAKTRAVYVEYRKAGYSKKFRAEHEADILLHQAAKKYFDSIGITKLPSVKSLREEYAGLLEQKRKAYAAYKQARSDMKELHNIKANVDYLLDIPASQEQQKDKQKSRQ